jgi:Tol biopolymer transport system component
VVWRDRAGRDVAVIDAPGAFTQPRISPDGRWIALTVGKPKLEIWLYDVQRRVLAQLTRAPAAAFNAVWLPDSRRIVYTFESPVYDLHLIPIDGSAPDRTLLAGAYDKYASSVSLDGRQMLVTETFDGQRVLLASTADTIASRPLSETGSRQRLAVFSPDGRWIAFAQTDGGRSDVYIRSASGTGGRRLVSAGGGYQPRWTKGGREIVYLTGAAMMSVAVDPATGDVGMPTQLFRSGDVEHRLDDLVHSYDVTADGQRFLVIKPVARPATQPLVVTLNWRPNLGAARNNR